MSLPHSLGLPYPRYLLVVLRRTGVMWVLARLFAFFFLLLVVRTDFASAVAQPVFGLPAVFVWLDRRFYHETLLPANLGSAELWFWAVSLTTALGMDLLAAVALSWI